MKKDNKAFSLIELLVAIAIIGILAAVVLVSMSSYGKRARTTKALAQLSSAIPGMVSCWGNGGEVRIPEAAGGGSICYIDGSVKDSYGKWPTVSSGDLSSWIFNPTANPDTEGSACPSDSGKRCLNKAGWAVFLYSPSANDGSGVCCNITLNGCKNLLWATGGFGTCDKDTPAN